MRACMMLIHDTECTYIIYTDIFIYMLIRSHKSQGVPC